MQIKGSCDNLKLFQPEEVYFAVYQGAQMDRQKEAVQIHEFVNICQLHQISKYKIKHFRQHVSM